MRITEIKSRPVIDPTTARRCGTVVDVQVDPTARRLVALQVASADADSTERILAASIARIGRDAVILTGTTVTASETTADADNYLDYGSLVGLEVLDEDGHRVGYLKDAKFDPERLNVSQYELAHTFWHTWLHRRTGIEPGDVTSWSRELMLVKPNIAAKGVLPASSPLQAAGPPTRTLADGRTGDVTDAIRATSEETHGARVEPKRPSEGG